MDFVKENGFINYFGPQRFGTGKIPSHDVGRAVLQSNWEQVIDLILSPDNRNDTKEALEYFQKTKDFENSIKKLHRFSIEGKIIAGLQKNGEKAYLNAFSTLPRNMRTLYVHAYQSFIWNEITSRRIEKFGLKPIVGDLIILTEQPKLHNEENDNDISDENDIDKIVSQDVKILTQEDIDNNTYSITDIVLPLPGYDIKLPANEIAEYYKELLEKDNLDISLRHKLKLVFLKIVKLL